MSLARGQRSVPALRHYLLTWVALLVLLLIAVVTAYIPLGVVNVALNLGIAVAKALLVMVVFMELGASRPVVRLAAAAGFFWLALLFVLTLADYATR